MYVVGYHGAGIANAFFMKNSTSILEISTYTDLNGTKPWRSNMHSVAMYGRYKQLVLRLPLQQLLTANNASYRTRDPDHFIKNLRLVALTRKNIKEIVAFGRETKHIYRLAFGRGRAKRRRHGGRRLPSCSPPPLLPPIRDRNLSCAL